MMDYMHNATQTYKNLTRSFYSGNDEYIKSILLTDKINSLDINVKYLNKNEPSIALCLVKYGYFNILKAVCDRIDFNKCDSYGKNILFQDSSKNADKAFDIFLDYFEKNNIPYIDWCGTSEKDKIYNYSFTWEAAIKNGVVFHPSKVDRLLMLADVRVDVNELRDYLGYFLFNTLTDVGLEKLIKKLNKVDDINKIKHPVGQLLSVMDVKILQEFLQSSYILNNKDKYYDVKEGDFFNVLTSRVELKKLMSDNNNNIKGRGVLKKI